ncbi:MAG: hypothetical protein HRO68_03530 [Nitrosopumilus sp.]|nr:hypothetical protein [Nitrosopumilus sp.]
MSIDFQTARLDEDCIAYNDELQGTQLELELFKRTNLKNKNIIVIEKNKIICLQLSFILKKIGFNVIKFCENIEQGFHIFKQIHENYEEAIIFLSFFSNDSSIMKTIAKILEINAHTKIILLKSPEKNILTNMVLMIGVFDILEIPLSMPKVTSIIEKIKQEYHDEKEYHTQNIIQLILSTRKNINVLELSELTGTNSKTIKEFLEFLESSDKAKNIGKTKMISCNNCESILVEEFFLCPNCNLEKFTQKDLIEHYSCGNVSLEKEYKDEMCPKCKKLITAVGVDYRKIHEYFICNECKEKFSEPKSMYSCKKCNSEFALTSAKWVETEKFLLINESSPIKNNSKQASKIIS